MREVSLLGVTVTALVAKSPYEHASATQTSSSTPTGPPCCTFCCLSSHCGSPSFMLKRPMQAVIKAIEAQDKLVEEAKLGIVEAALGTNEY